MGWPIYHHTCTSRIFKLYTQYEWSWLDISHIPCVWAEETHHKWLFTFPQPWSSLTRTCTHCWRPARAQNWIHSGFPKKRLWISISHLMGRVWPGGCWIVVAWCFERLWSAQQVVRPRWQWTWQSNDDSNLSSPWLGSSTSTTHYCHPILFSHNQLYCFQVTLI